MKKPLPFFGRWPVLFPEVRHMISQKIFWALSTLRGSMGGFGTGRSGGRATTEDGLTLSLSKLFRDRLFRPGCAWGGSLVWTNTTTGERVGSMSYQAHLGQESGRVRLITRPPYGTGSSVSRITGSSSRQRPNPSAAGGGGSSARGRGGGRRNSIFRTAPSPSHRAKRTGSLTAASANNPIIGHCGAPSSCGASSGLMAASAAMCPNRNGCAGQPMTGSSRKSSPPRRSSMPTR